MIVRRNLRVAKTTMAFLPHMLGFALWDTLVVLLYTLGHFPQRLGLEPGMLVELNQAMHWGAVGLPFGAIAALGGALAIFLGFRNSSAYDRWWEARKIWGGLVNDSRSWCRQAVAWAEAPPGAQDPEAAAHALRVELIHRHLAFVHGLAHHLRQQRAELLATVARFVPEDEARRYAEVPNVPTALLIQQGRRVAEARNSGQIEHFRHLSMDAILTRLSDIQGKCERIKNTPVPPQYDTFPRWFAYSYGAILPLGLVEPIGWGAVPVGVGLTVIFLSLEASGRIIEDPFENTPMDTPMTALSLTIERDLRAALGEPLPESLAPDDNGVLM